MNESTKPQTILPADREQPAARPAETERTVTIPTPSRDVLTEILHDGAQRLLAQAIDAEVADWIARHTEVLDDDGRRQIVRNGHHPTRTILTGSTFGSKKTASAFWC